MANPSNSVVQNLLPVQAYFTVDGVFQTFIGQGKPFFATINPIQSGLTITNSTIDSSTIGANSPSTGVFTNILSTTGQLTTTPSGNTDIANKYYVDTVAQGLGPKAACQVATTVNITLSGLQTIDGYTTLSGDRVLVKNQTNSAQNGIYIASSGAWTRSNDLNVWSEVSGAYTVILNGGQADTGWVCTASSTGTIGVTPMPWVQFSAASTYFAGTGLTLASNTFSITNTGVVNGSYGSASQTLIATVNAQGQLTSLSASNIAISASQTTSGTFSSSLLSGSYTGITGVGTLTTGTWNASTIGVAYGGTGATTLTGYVKGNGVSAFTASTTIPTTDLSGTITNAQLQNSTISGVSLGSNLFSLTIGSGLSGTSYNGSSAVTITNSSPMVYPSSGIPNSTGTSWGTSYSTTGSGTVVALATGASLSNPTISNYQYFTPTSAPTYVQGDVWYDSSADALAYYNGTTNNVLHIGQELQQQVRNSTGSTITKGSVVYISGSTGQIGNIILAQANAYSTSQVIGVANQDIPNNTNGYVVTQGLVQNINTSTFTAGNPIYLSATTAGALTQTEPSTPNYSVHMGVCLYSNTNNGKIWINPINKSIDTSYIIGQVAIAQGGTNGTATPTSGAIAYGNGSSYAFTSAGTTGQVLTSNGSGTPTWSTPTAYATVTDDTTTNATRYPLFANQTSGNLTTEYTSSTKYQFNPSTGVLTSTSFSGAGTALTGTASGLSIGGNAATATSATTATTATNLAGGANGSLPYQTGSGATTFLAAGTNGYILTLASGVPTWASAPVTGVTITDDTTTNATRYITFTSATSGTITGENVSSTKLQYNPSTGLLTTTSFSGAGTGLTGTASSLSIGGNAATATSATTATNIAGGAANQIHYQTGSGATSFITAPSVSSTYLQWNGTAFTWATVSSGGVTSVTGTSPVVSSGGTTPAISLASGYGDTQNPYASKTANYVLAAPNGSAGTPSFRAIVASDIPTLNQNTTGTASNVTGTVAVANGGTGQTTASGAFNALSPITSTGDLIIGNGVNSATRLAIGTNGYVLTSNGTTATWSASSGGLTITDDTSTNATRYLTFTSATSGSITSENVSSTKLKYNPSTGELTSPAPIASNGIFVNSKTVGASYSIASGYNGMSVGPMTIASGQSVSVASGQRWLVL